MGVIKLKQLLPGMVLKTNVLDHNNRVLLTHGTTINDKHIKTLKSWGIVEVQVADNATQVKATIENTAANPELIRQTREEMSRLFRHTNRNDPVIKELFSLCVERKINLETGKKR